MDFSKTMENFMQCSPGKNVHLMVSCYVGMRLTCVYHNPLIHFSVSCHLMENVLHWYFLQGVTDDNRF